MNTKVSGFTLLEMLIAMSLLGLMLVLLGSGLTISRHALEMSDRYTARLTEIRAAQDFLRGALQQALPLAFDGNQYEQGQVFEGDSRHLRFVAALPNTVAGRLQVHSLSLVDNSLNGQDLQVVFTQLSSAGSLPWGEPQRLLHDLSRLQLSYRGLDEQQKLTNWMPTWPWPKRLPHYVRIQIDARGPVRWSPLIVALRINLDASPQVLP